MTAQFLQQLAKIETDDTQADAIGDPNHKGEQLNQIADIIKNNSNNHN